MTPKMKAKELFNKYCYAIRTEERDSGYFTNVIYAKQCALIAVDEILRAIKSMVDEESGYSADEYYLEVKQEIEKL